VVFHQKVGTQHRKQLIQPQCQQSLTEYIFTPASATGGIAAAVAAKTGGPAYTAVGTATAMPMKIPPALRIIANSLSEYEERKAGTFD
jgi:hypothetical protein